MLSAVKGALCQHLSLAYQINEELKSSHVDLCSVPTALHDKSSNRCIAHPSKYNMYVEPQLACSTLSMVRQTF